MALTAAAIRDIKRQAKPYKLTNGDGLILYVPQGRALPANALPPLAFHPAGLSNAISCSFASSSVLPSKAIVGTWKVVDNRYIAEDFIANSKYGAQSWPFE